MKKINLSAKWIWAKENTLVNDYVIFRKNITLNSVPKSCNTYIACDTKYYLYINGDIVVFEGGLFRESMPSAGWVDEVDIAPYLKNGVNNITLMVNYYGNEGRNNVDSKMAGMILQCEVIGLYSNSLFNCKRHPAYYKTSERNSSYLHGGDNTAFDANKDIGCYYSTDFDEAGFECATEYDDSAWGDLYLRPVPFIKQYDKKNNVKYAKTKEGYIVDLPHAMTFSFIFNVTAKSGDVVHVETDRYRVNGGPGDDTNVYSGHRIEYICKDGINEFEALTYLYGEYIFIKTSSGVKINHFGYHENGYNCEFSGDFVSENEIVNRLVKKSARTLYVCMRDNFMDCPDRERGQWIGDVSVQSEQIAYLLDSNALKLLRKATLDFFNLRKGDVLVGNVPGADFGELPSQSLNAISEIGLVANYVKHSGDTDVLSVVFEPSVKYLMLWDMGENGLVKPRKGNWRWFDHLFNCDEDVLENAWYYSALKYAKSNANAVNNHEYDEFLNTRITSIEKNFNKIFWNGDYYTSTGTADERANAMAVLVGLCKSGYYVQVKRVLQSVQTCTPYMENYVLIALCKMGYVDDAYRRMIGRYYNLAIDDSTTMWEDFNVLGTRNHAWSGAPATISYKYLAGIEIYNNLKDITVNPQTTMLKQMKIKLNGLNGVVYIDIDTKGKTVSIINNSESKVVLINDEYTLKY